MASRSQRRAPARNAARPHAVDKISSGIQGLDEITEGGFPRGRATLICGGPGCGKTLFGIEFLVNGALKGEPGVIVSFEESEADLLSNAWSLGHDLTALERKKLLAIQYVRIERSEIEETGEYDLEGLFIRIDHALRSVGAKRIVLDTIEALFAGLTNDGLLRAEIRRLFGWLKERGITALVTGERDGAGLTRHGLQEYVSDCVLLLDHRVTDQVSTRRLRVVKYRGSRHGTNEYPFIIDDHGVAVLPITSLQLMHNASAERVSTGLPWLDEMFGGKGFYRNTSILVSGGAGTAKTTMAAHFVDAACRRGERAALFVFEESPAQYIRNMRSVGLDMDRWVRSGRLRLYAARPTVYGLESHLATMHRQVEEIDPAIVVVDPLSGFIGGTLQISGMVTRLIDFLKGRNITAMFTHLIPGSAFAADVEAGVSSLMDTWLLLRNAPPGEHGGRHLAVLKSRGMAHSAEERRFTLTDRGAVALDHFRASGSPR